MYNGPTDNPLRDAENWLYDNETEDAYVTFTHDYGDEIEVVVPVLTHSSQTAEEQINEFFKDWLNEWRIKW